ncbi:hypothetical protein [Streptomyces malaysiensis]|uniref:hypothetical protein n=1 Tax=Streptomyces malaysiensis TaxID=92644 RepID=UPI0036CB771E
MNEFISKHGVRLFAVVAAVTPFLVTRFPDIPWEALAAAAAALLGAGEVAQRHEDSKTSAALQDTSPWDLAEVAQAAVHAFEEKLRKTDQADEPVTD